MDVECQSIEFWVWSLWCRREERVNWYDVTIHNFAIACLQWQSHHHGYTQIKLIFWWTGLKIWPTITNQSAYKQPTSGYFTYDRCCHLEFISFHEKYSFLENCCWVKESLEYRDLRDWLGNLQLTQTPSVQTTVSPVWSLPCHYLQCRCTLTLQSPGHRLTGIKWK